THQIRFHHQSENCQADRLDNSAECAGAGGPGHQIILDLIVDFGSRRKSMPRKSLALFHSFRSGNLKSTIHNRKWPGISTIAFVLMIGTVAEAQMPKGMPQIGFLSAGVPSARQNSDTFLHGLKELGYVEGKNIGIVYRYGEGNVDRLPQLAAELVRLNVNVIVAGGTV